MRPSVERLRWWLVAGAAALVLTLVALVAVGHWKAARLWQDIQRRSGGSLVREADGFTWSQSLGGKTVATLHASRAIEHSHNQWTLHDVVITAYGRVAGRADRLYGDTFEYNSDTGVARAIGVVHMDLQAPAALAESHRATPGIPEPLTADAVHVETTGLVYVRKLGIAATDGDVEIRYDGVTGSSRGAEFDLNGSAVHLLASVRADGLVRGQMMHATAGRADFDRTSGLLVLQTPTVVSGDGQIRAAHAEVQLARDSAVQRLVAGGGVEARRSSPTRGNAVLTAAALDVRFGAESRPQLATWTGDVTAHEVAQGTITTGHANAMTWSFNAGGQPTGAVAQGGVQLDRRTPAAVLQQLRASRLTAVLVAVRGAKRSSLRSMQLTGGATLAQQTPSAGPTRPATQDELRGGTIDAAFDAGDGVRSVLRTLVAAGATRLEQRHSEGVDRVSEGDTLHADLALLDGRLQVTHATQAGGVHFMQTAAAVPGAHQKGAAMQGEAAQVQYTAAADTAVLSGKARLQQAGDSLSADSVTVHLGSGNAAADGDVVATLLATATAPASTLAAPGTDAARTYVSANRAQLDHTTDVATFYAGARPVRMWQGGSQLSAGVLVLNGKERTLKARAAAGSVAPVQVLLQQVRTDPAAQVRTGTAARSPGDSATVVAITAGTFVYSEGLHQATMTGDVVLRSADATVHAKHGDVLFAAPAHGTSPAGDADAAATSLLRAGTLEQAEMRGDVRVLQPGRTATGTRLLYTAASGAFLLTGTPAAPPVATSEGQGTVTGASLLLRPGDASVVVSGGPGLRARTVTEVKRAEP